MAQPTSDSGSDLAPADRKEAVRAFFAQHAAAYARSYRRPRADIDRLMALLPTQPHWQAVDVAAGTGRVTVAVAPRVREVVAVDLTPEMEPQFWQTLREAGVTNARFQLGDAEQLPLPSASADLVTCVRAAHHFPRVERALAEMARLLRPGGYLGLADMAVPDDPQGAAFFNALEVARDASHVRALSRREWLALLPALGFEVEAVELHEEAIPLEQWLSPLPPDGAEARRVQELLAQASPEVKELVLHAPGEPLVLRKHRLILVACKSPEGG